ncbi:HAMP domain-containing histidine kinase [Altererythrobacter sp. RZ02]|uniref:histidine kinase n=1 Tax=Pontixanthobacter rizhaonensis TaxID=2730337 RepID=A0A848QIZ1_9SPHN|nr:HAMP domain-containing histidine kinase [Pontixanthobacter rizhaonensis]NMW31024.1 HAMP domain-containing histidine kinase [Pontixanthobacter rizhaonensis]
MHFDDRLATVLRHRAAGERAARTQFRQLLDLLGSQRGGRDQSLLAAAWLRLAALSETIPAADRAAMINDPGLRFRNPELAAHLAEDEPEVAAAALARANLTEDDWEALIPRLPVRARGFLRLRKDLEPSTNAILAKLGILDRGLPQPETQEPEVQELETQEPDTPVTAAPAGAPDQTADPEPGLPAVELPENDNPPIEPPIAARDNDTIGAIVERIEQFRKARSNQPLETTDPRLPLGEIANDDGKPAITGFSFTCDPAGRVDWADTNIAPSIIGTRLNTGPMQMAIRFRQPIRKEPMHFVGAPAITGAWIVDALPRFAQPEGHFRGYAGRFYRAAETADLSDIDEVSSEADRLRQLLHELRTPVNAIQGFSEVIQQQLFGPTPHEYRALAAGIAGDSARMLAGFDELDRLARLETGALDVEVGRCDFAAIISGQIEQLQNVLKPKTAEFALRIIDTSDVTLAQSEAEALAWRLLATLASYVGAGEHIHVELAENAGALRLCCELPASLSGKPDIFATTMKPASGALSAGMFGAGFALRLARAEARSAGGDLVRVDDWLLLSLPLLTVSGSAPSPKQLNGAVG